MSHFTTSAAADLFNHQVLGYEYTDADRQDCWTIDSLLDQAEAAGCLRTEVAPITPATQATVKQEVAALYEYYVEIGLEVSMNNIYREVYNRHGLLAAYEDWKQVPVKARKQKSFLRSLPVG